MNEQEQQILQLNQQIINSEFSQRVIDSKSWALAALKEIRIEAVNLYNLNGSCFDLEHWIFKSDYTKMQSQKIILDFIDKWTRESEQDPYQVDTRIQITDLGISNGEYDFYQVTIIY